ncbi:MAG TPA: hypothetical protein VE134_04575 [Methanomicrobiales archaeon]|nr:hypothetical protein [Methanomicrobiales archaeon]
MKDPRLRLVAVIALSISAYVSLLGAAVALVWWLAFTERTHTLSHPRVLGAFVGLLAVISGIVQILGGDGISYFVRFSVIALIASWAFADRRAGELLDVATWGLGTRIGFEIGLVAEMSIRSLEVMAEDFARIRLAQEIKGVPWGIRSIVPAVSSLVQSGIQRAEDQADLLAIRGYQMGGTVCPVFESDLLEKAAAGLAVLAGLALFVPSGDIFILLH